MKFKRFMKKRFIYVVGTLLFFLVILFTIKYVQIQKAMANLDNFAAPSVYITVIHAEKKIWQNQVNTVGTLNAMNGVMISSEVSGLVSNILFSSGQNVKKGELLVQLDDSVERANYDHAIAEENVSQLIYNRIHKMYKEKNVSETEYDEAEANLKKAQASVKLALARLNQKKVLAPFDGLLGIRQINLGEYINPGVTLVNLEHISHLYIDFSISEKYFPQIVLDADVYFTVNAYNDKIFTAKVVALESKVDENIRTISIRAKFDNQEAYLLPGMYADVDLHLEGKKSVVVLPSSAVQASSFGDMVFIVKPDENNNLRAYKKYVKIGEKRGDLFSIESGLKAGERVVASGASKLKNEQIVLITDLE